MLAPFSPTPQPKQAELIAYLRNALAEAAEKDRRGAT